MPTSLTSHARPRPPLRDVRISRGLGLREVARAAKIDPGHLSRIERGEAQPSYEVLLRLARVLEISPLVKLLAPYAKGEPR